MRVTSDFECGNGKNIVEIAPGHFRIEEEGEKSPYCKYFCVRVDGGAEGGIAELSIYPDPLLGDAGRIGFMGHYPSKLWFSESEMTFWQPVTNRWPDADVFGDDHICTRVAVPAGEHVYVASNLVWPYSQLQQWSEAMVAKGAESFPMGMSFEGRPIPRLHLPAGDADPLRVMVLSGQHPSEHCATLGAAGIVEFLLSQHPEAQAMRRGCDVWAMPMINVDGNVHGRNGWTMQDVNPCEDFSRAVEGVVPKAEEDRQLWRWLTEEFRPDIIFHFHGYLGTRGCADTPYDGMYVFNDAAAVYRKPEDLARYRLATDLLFWDTAGLSASTTLPEHQESHLETQLALACGTTSVFYEINHGFAGVAASKQRGAHVFRSVMRALLACR